MSLTGRGLPRLTAAADSRPQAAATASSPGSTAISASQAASSPRAPLAPVTDLGPLGQLAERDEGDHGFTADQPRGQRPGELTPVQPRGDIGVQDDRIHGGRSGQIAVTLGVGERQELLQLLVRLKGVSSKLIEGPYRASALGRQQLRG